MCYLLVRWTKVINLANCLFLSYWYETTLYKEKHVIEVLINLLYNYISRTGKNSFGYT